VARIIEPARALSHSTLAAGARALARRDPDLAGLFRRNGMPPMWARRPGFATLVHIVLEQQVSIVAARTLYQRLRNHLGEMTPQAVAAHGVARLRRFGLTRQKASYCHELALAVQDGKLDLTGVARTHDDACDRAARAGRDVERAFGLHPTLGVAATRLVSGIAAHVLAPDGELLEVRPGNEEAFLAPLAARVLPAARGAATAARLDLLNVRVIRDVQALEVAAMEAAFGRAAALSLWRESRGQDGAPARAAEAPPGAVAEETLSTETNDRRVLVARIARLAMEVAMGLRARGGAARRLAVAVTYADGRGDRARATLAEPARGERALRAAAIDLFDRAVKRRVRVRRLRLEAWGADASAPTQLTLWSEATEPSWCTAEGGAPMNPEGASAAAREAGGEDRSPEGSIGAPPGAARRADALETALHRVRLRFGTEVLIPASWMALGVVRPSPRP